MIEISLDQEINDQKLKIEDAKKVIAESEIILKYLESKRGSTNIQHQISQNNNGSIVLNIDDLISSTIIKESRTKTMTTDVMDAISHFGEREFNVPMIAKVMAKLQTIDNSEDKLTRSKISTILSQQTKNGALVMTFKGGGNVPHKYRIRSNSEELIEESVAHKNLEDHSETESTDEAVS